MKLKHLLSVLLAGIIGLAGCTRTKEVSNKVPEGIPTFANISIVLSSKSQQPGKRALPEDYNDDGTYAGKDWIKTLDIYMQKSDGTLEDAMRFSGNDLTISNNVVSPSQPFRTTSGLKNIYIVINDTESLGNTITSEDALIDIDGLAKIENNGTDDLDVIMMTGKATSVTIAEGVTAQQVIGGQNRFEADVIRLASRAIVTTTSTGDVINQDAQKIGTIENITYSVAQGTKKIYWLPRTDYTTYGSEPGAEYIPVYGEYIGAGNAEKYYDYSGLSDAEIVPGLPSAGDGYKSLPGKFLFENTHTYGPTRPTTAYRQGNTAYILVRGKFIPENIVNDEPLPANGTFYVGHADGRFYASIETAQTEHPNQKVAMYPNGKVLYFAWLNPDDKATPLNSPVLRNNIYHVNIKSFSRVGQNWNPLYPEDPDTGIDNPDPKPVNPWEPENPIDPILPLTPEETYMTVDVNILEWTSHSYEIEF